MSEKRLVVDEDYNWIELGSGKMSEKRLVVDEDYNWIDTKTGYCIEMEDAFELVNQLWEENEQLRKIGLNYQGEHPCESCVYALEQKVCCVKTEPLLIEEMKKEFMQGLCLYYKRIRGL